MMSPSKLSALGLALSFTLTASLAGAAGKYTKKESEIVASQTGLTKPTQKAVEKKDRPSYTADDIFGGVGEKVKSVTDAQIGVLQRLIDNTADNDPEKPDLLFRMAELYAEQQRYYNFKSRDLDQKIFDAQAAKDGPLEQKLKADQAKYQKYEHDWLVNAVKKYLAIVNPPGKYASYKKMDEVLFYLAYLLTQVKREDDARTYFKRLIKDYPQSKFLPDAFLSFGEYYFDNKELEKALTFYEKVMQYPDSRVYGYARYKEAWVYYNIGDFKQSLATFVDVIKLSQRPGGSKKSKLGLEKEAKKDSVRAYARIGTPDKAWAFFKNIGGDYALTMLEALGELYNSQGQFQDSIKVYRQLIALEPKSPKVCNWQTEVMHNTLSYTGSKAHPDNVKELQRLADVYESYKSNKAIKQSDLDECKDNTANTLRELATVWHKEAQKTNDMGTYDLAQYLYKEYINKFPKEKDIYIMTFYYAELLFKLGSMGDNKQPYCEAAPIYSKVVHLDTNPKAKYLKEAAYAAVISWKNCLAVEDSAQEAADATNAKRKEKAAAKGKGKDDAPPEEVYVKKEIPDRQKKMIEAFDEYIKFVPESNELCTIKYRKARIYFDYNHIDEATPLYKDVVDSCKTSELAVYSANLYIDCLVIKKDYKAIADNVDAFLQRQELTKDQGFVNRLKSIKVQLAGKVLEQLQHDKKYVEAARMGIKMAEENPQDPKLDVLYFDAGVNFEKAKLIGAAIQSREALIKLRPDSPQAKKAIYLVGRNYQDIAAFELAAKSYEDFAAKYPGEKEAPIALNTASFFRRGLGENEKSFDDTKLFTRNYGGRHEFIDQAAGVNFYEYQIFEQKHDNDGLQKHFTSYLKEWGTKGGVDRQIIAHAKLAELAWKASCPAPNGGVNGACIELIRERAGGKARVESKQKKGKKQAKKKGLDLPKQCGPATKSKVIVHERTPARAKEALAHFAEVMKLWKAGAATHNVPGKDETERAARIADMTFYAAEARMVEADQQYEKFLKLAIPDKLDFTPPQPDMSPAKAKAQKAKVEASTKAFGTYFTNKTKLLGDTQKIYQSVILFKNAHWAIAAAARIGQLFQDFSGQLYTAPVPKAPPGIDEAFFHDAYCDMLVDKAEPVESHAIEGLSACLGKSTELSWFNEWSTLCESELNQIKPNEYPLAAEIRAQPGYSSVAGDRTDVQSIEVQ